MLPDELWIRRKGFAAGMTELPLLRKLWIEEAVQFSLADEFRSEIESARTGNPILMGIQERETNPEG